MGIQVRNFLRIGYVLQCNIQSVRYRPNHTLDKEGEIGENGLFGSYFLKLFSRTIF